jgi:hypothetical protein
MVLWPRRLVWIHPAGCSFGARFNDFPFLKSLDVSTQLVWFLLGMITMVPELWSCTMKSLRDKHITQVFADMGTTVVCLPYSRQAIKGFWTSIESDTEVCLFYRMSPCQFLNDGEIQSCIPYNLMHGNDTQEFELVWIGLERELMLYMVGLALFLQDMEFFFYSGGNKNVEVKHTSTRMEVALRLQLSGPHWFTLYWCVAEGQM